MYRKESVVSGIPNKLDNPSPYGDIRWNRDTSSSSKARQDNASTQFTEAMTRLPMASANRRLARDLPESGAWSYSLWLNEDLVDPVVDGVLMICRLFHLRSFPRHLETEGIRNNSQLVTAEVNRLFSLATFIDLEPGMTNEFSIGLQDAIERYGEQAIDAIEDTILNRNTKSPIAMEALQYIAYTDSDKWHEERRRMIERCLLKSPSAWVRDGAGLGLASLDNPKSIPALEAALLDETSEALKEDLTLVLHQLRGTLREQ